MFNYLLALTGYVYTNDNFIIQDIDLKNISVNDKVVFNYKFKVDPNHPALGEENVKFIKPKVVGYVQQGSIVTCTINMQSSTISPSNFDKYLETLEKESSVTFSAPK